MGSTIASDGVLLRNSTLQNEQNYPNHKPTISGKEGSVVIIPNNTSNKKVYIISKKKRKDSWIHKSDFH